MTLFFEYMAENESNIIRSKSSTYVRTKKNLQNNGNNFIKNTTIRRNTKY